MNKQNLGILILIGVCIAIMVFGILYVSFTRKPEIYNSTTISVGQKLDWYTYTNTQYGFELKYPQSLVTTSNSSPQNGDIVEFVSKTSLRGADMPEKIISIKRIGDTPTNQTSLEKILTTYTIFDASGMSPQSLSEFAQERIGNNTFYSIRIGRFEGVVSFAYYLVNEKGVFKFDVISQGVENWMEPTFNEQTDAGRVLLKQILGTLSFGK